MITEFATLPHPDGRGKDNTLVVQLIAHNFNLPELGFKSNAVHKENISKNHWTVPAQHAQTSQGNTLTRT